MAIEQKNPNINNDETNNGSNAPTTPPNEAPLSRAERRRRNKPRRDGKGSNALTNDQTLNKVGPSKRRIDKDNKTALVTSAAIDADGTLNDSLDQAADEAAIAEGGLKAIGTQRIIGFMKIEKPMALLSILLVIGSIITIAINGLNLGLDFTGGVSTDVVYEQPVEQSAVVNALKAKGFDDAVVQYLGTRQELLIRLPPQSDSVDGLNASLSSALNLPNNPAKISNVNIIGSQVGNEIYLNSVMAIALALACMLGYVALRFEFKLALGAVVSLFHDTVVTIGIFSLFGWPFDLTVLAAILALIGYSLNDTIVVYDRIRENFRRVRGITPRQILDLSLTETLRRTIMTISTVMLVVVAMMLLGGEGLHWFSVALFIGLIAGTYSSIYIASSIPLRMGLSRDDFVVKVKPEFEEEIVSFDDPKMYEEQS
ncbi:MAG: protein translocase subunit SecF [Psychrobacter sp.]|nr:protein translocase subunit SecF [Psychrobacter sp.]